MQSKSGINQHKLLAMGKPVTGMRKGGAVHDDVKEDKALVRKMVKPDSLAKRGGSVEAKEKESASAHKREGAKGERAEMRRGGKC